MDHHLQSLKRKTTANNDVESWQKYAMALERIIGGEELEPEFVLCFSTLVCPDCNADLTTVDSIAIRAAVEGLGTLGGALLSCLEEDGKLVDVNDIVAKGLVSGVDCSECWLNLEEYEGSLRKEKENNLP